MKFLVALSCLLAAASAQVATSYSYSTASAHPVAYTAPVHHAVAAPVHHPVVAPVHHPVAVSVHHPIATPVHHPIAAPVHHPIAVVPTVDKTQHHSQDILGQASYGHTEAFQHHHATQDAAGNKAGSYSWVAPDGQVIAAKYVADAFGYRVASNALPASPAVPVETPEVIAARAAHFNAHLAVKSRARRGVVSYSSPYFSANVYSPIHHGSVANHHYGFY